MWERASAGRSIFPTPGRRTRWPGSSFDTKYTSNLTKRHSVAFKEQITGGILSGSSVNDIAKQINRLENPRDGLTQFVKYKDTITEKEILATAARNVKDKYPKTFGKIRPDQYRKNVSRVSIYAQLDASEAHAESVLNARANGKNAANSL